MGTQEYCKMLKRIQVLEDGRVPAVEARNWSIEGQKRRITRQEYQRLLNKLERESFMAQKGLESCLRKDPEGKGSVATGRGCDALERTRLCLKKFLSSWVREYGREKEERMVEVTNENEEERR